MMKFRALTAAAVVAGFVGVGTAGAATISDSDTFGSLVVSGSDTAVLSQFDPSLGTLVQVELFLDANTDSGSISFDNEALIASDVDLGIGAEVTATAPSALAVVAVPLQVGSDTVDADNDGAADFLGTDAFSVVGGSGSDSDSNTLTTGLAPFIGLGTINVDITSSVETFLSTTGGFGPIDPNPGNFDGTVTVVYTYNPIPEPASFALMGLGGLAMLRRRR